MSRRYPSDNRGPLCTAIPAIGNGRVDLDAIVDALRAQKKPCSVLLQAGCHNPTGIDLTTEQWKALMPELQNCGSIVFLDIAYQGFADDPEVDAWALRTMTDAGITCLVSWSAAKNHSMYSLRAGLSALVVPDEETKHTVEAHYSMLTRGLWSAAPVTGQQVVARTQEQYHKEWLEDLSIVRTSLQRKRDALQKHLPSAFHAPLQGKGLFAILPLTLESILRLRSEQKVFVLDDGRMNIAGLPEERLEEFCEKVLRVYS